VGEFDLHLETVADRYKPVGQRDEVRGPVAEGKASEELRELPVAGTAV
jgi:hypothetical protein